jgi:hypothetical protein
MNIRQDEETVSVRAIGMTSGAGRMFKLVWFVWLIWFIWLAWFNHINKTNQITFFLPGELLQRPAENATGPETVFVRSITSSSVVLANNVSQRLCRCVMVASLGSKNKSNPLTAVGRMG